MLGFKWPRHHGGSQRQHSRVDFGHVLMGNIEMMAVSLLANSSFSSTTLGTLTTAQQVVLLDVTGPKPQTIFAALRHARSRGSIRLPASISRLAASSFFAMKTSSTLYTGLMVIQHGSLQVHEEATNMAVDQIRLQVAFLRMLTLPL